MSAGLTLPSALIAASASIIFALGALHLLYTYRGPRFHPRDAALEARMKEVAPRISSRTTMWRAGIGFHASHSLGAMLFGLVYADLALVEAPLLWGSTFLLALGAVALASWLLLAQRYWFRIPLRGIGLAAALYSAALIVHAL